jgi:tRNA 2-thiouridine synthesizing protein A
MGFSAGYAAFNSNGWLFQDNIAMTDHLLDTKGMKCPLPVLKARKALKALDVGEVLIVEATDPGSLQDFRSFCETTGHELLVAGQSDSIFTFYIKKNK